MTRADLLAGVPAKAPVSTRIADGFVNVVIALGVIVAFCAAQALTTN